MTYLYNTQEAAEVLGVKPVTIRYRIYAGIISARKYGRDWMIEPDEIMRVQANPPERGWRKAHAARMASLGRSVVY